MNGQQNKITYSDSIQAITFKMAEGNPDGFHAAMQMAIQENPNPLKGYTTLLLCDQAELYGSQLWKLWEHCGQDLNKVYQVLEDLRTNQLSREEFFKNLSQVNCIVS